MLSPTAAQPSKSTFLRRRSTPLAFALLTLPWSVCAQPGTAPSTPTDLFSLSLEELMDVRVSVASLMEESTRDAPATVAKVTRDEWNRNGARRLSDALEGIPSVIAYESWGGSEAIAIRGYSTELSVRGIDSSLDGVPLNSYTHATSSYQLPNPSLDLLDQVEMIRGPGSTLYGTDAFHGVLALQTRASTTDTSEASGTLGSPRYGKGSYFTSAHDGQRALNAGFSYERQGEQNIHYRYTSPSDGSVQDAERDNIFRNISGFATLQWGERGDTGQWKLSGFTNQYQANSFPGVGTQFFQSVPSFYDLQSASLSRDRDHTGQDSRFVMAQLQHALELSNALSIENRLYHWRSDFTWRYDNSRYPESLVLRVNNTSYPCRTATTNPLTMVNSIYCPHELSQQIEENRTGVQSLLRAQHIVPGTSLVFGTGWDHQKVLKATAARQTASGDYLLRNHPAYSGESREILYGFVQGKSALHNEELALHYGLRYDRYSDGEAHTSPRLGLIYHATKQWTSKWLYGHAFRAPNASEQYVTTDSASTSLKPETMDSLEWINTFHGERFQHELVLFANHWKDGIILTPLGSGGVTNVYVNSGDSEALGVEFSSRYRHEALTLNASASYTDSTNTDTDREYVAFPSWGFTLQAGYRFDAPRIDVTLKQRVLLDYADSDQITHSDRSRTNSYVRTDLSLSKQLVTAQDGHAPELFAHFYNLFDRDNALPALYNAENGIPDNGFQIALGARWKW